MKKTLQEITGQESGIVCYGDDVIVCNWANLGGIGRPVLSPVGGILGFPVDNIKVISSRHLDDIRDALPGKIVSVGKNDEGTEILEAESMEILYDCNNDICALWGYSVDGAYVKTDENGNLIPTAGWVYEIEFGGVPSIVIAPDDWI